MAVNTINDQEFKEVLESHSKVAVQFYADWCGSCRLFKPKFRRLSGDERFEGTQFYYINAEENQEARKAAGVDNLPFFAVFKDGKMLEGYASAKEEAVVELLSKLN